MVSRREMRRVLNQVSWNTQGGGGKFQEQFRRPYWKESDVGDDVEGGVTGDCPISAWKTGSF